VLQISPAAAEAIDAITRAVPGSAGVRISTMPQASTNGSGPVAVFDFYPTPEPGDEDQVVEEQGVQVFLEPEVIPLLEDKLLDAELDGDEVRFTVEPSNGDGAS
jgi:Fe-S cluster assembly iron-binding protein IscA